MNSPAIESRAAIKTTLVLVLVSVVFVGVFFSQLAAISGRADWLRTIVLEIQAACRDPGTQWMVVLCLVSYFAAFVVLESRRRRWPQENTENTEVQKIAHSSPRPTPLPSGAEKGRAFALFAFLRGNLREPDFWLSAFLFLALVRYAFAYEPAAKSLHVVVLLTGIFIGKGIAFWVRSPLTRPPATLSSGPSGGEERVRGILIVLVLLLAVSALWQTDLGMQYQYRGVPRWKGPWDNPNTYGVLMAAGAILGVGLLASRAARYSSQPPESQTQVPMAKVTRGIRILLLSGTTIVCGFGLVKSYSRGAWLGVVCGLGYLLWNCLNHETHQRHETTFAAREHRDRKERRPFPGALLWPFKEFSCRSCVSWLTNSWLALSAILLSLLILSFWQFRHSQSPVLRRVFSVANLNDFSWRNRVTVWQGSARMMVAHPFFGVGWGQVEKKFAEGYRAARLEESAAAQLNDYFTLANSAGLPALLCFLAYAAVAMRPRPGFPNPNSSGRLVALRPALLAAAVALLVGFWFDGGLFRLPACAVFWLLLELAGAIPSQVFRSPKPLLVPIASPGGFGTGSLPHGSLAQRWLAVILAALAIGVTALHLIPPQLKITPGRLKFAREHLIAPTEPPDFDFLSTNAIWAGKKLKTLLEHVELANYNRNLVNWKLDDELYRQFVLSPEISPEFDGSMHWRRWLWESFYPRIRKENSPATAAEIIVRHLRERVTIAVDFASPKDIEAIWIGQVTNDRGFEAIYVAALRSAGVAARLDGNARAEFFNGAEWKPAPRPMLEELRPQ